MREMKAPQGRPGRGRSWPPRSTCFVERGFAAAKLADVARRAGVTKGTVYLYFDSKEALFKAVVRETIVPVIAQGEALARILHKAAPASCSSGWSGNTGAWSGETGARPASRS